MYIIIIIERAEQKTINTCDSFCFRFLCLYVCLFVFVSLLNHSDLAL